MGPQKIAAIVMLVSLMLSAGLEINREHLMAALKNVGLIARALLANFIVVPIIGFAVVRLFHVEGYVAVGILLMTIAAGVPFLVRAAGRQSGGSLGFAAALAFIMPALSIVTIPLTALLVLPPDMEAKVPFVQLIVSLVGLQLVPLLIGLLVSDRAPALTAKLQRPLVLVFAVAVVALLIIISPELYKDVIAVYGSHGMLAALAIVLLSLVAGWVLGGPEPENRRTLSIATALRNIGTCAVIATASFPNTLVTPAVLSYFFIQFIVTVVFRIYLHRTAARPAAS
jgi:bile acid:Na+ symporter, BASS family